MINKKGKKQRSPAALKRKLTSALAMLLISTILMSTTSYAWFVLSTAPEVTGIETQVGANGSLEIALLNTDTRADMSTIRSGLGGSSLQAGNLSANNAWGNLIDLGYASYGLGELILMPARLDVSPSGDNYVVDLNKLLAVPTYGYDGRVIDLDHDTSTAIYQETGFLYSGAQDYGVRAVGTSDALSAQGSALVSAKSNISTYMKSARSGAQSALTKNGEGLFNIVFKYATDSSYDDTDKAVLQAMLSDLDSTLNYIDLALRQGLVAYAASALADENSFTSARDDIMDSENRLSDLLSQMEEVATVPEAFEEWVNKLETMQQKLTYASNSCNTLTGGTYDWDQIKPILTSIMDVDYVNVEGKKIDQLSQEELMEKVGGVIEMQLGPGSGLFADIADFAENYTVIVEWMYGTDIEMSTASAVRPAYLVALSNAVNELEPADGGEQSTALPLTATYGYAIDLAFRCNAAMPDLILQTAGVQRVYNGDTNGVGTDEDILSQNGTGQGGGSYMEFSSLDENFSLEQQTKLMDAIRVAFLDDAGTVLGIAKLNVTSRESENGVVKAPLYLYDYTYEQDETGYILNMGERRLVNNLITPLEQNVAKAVTVVVWLDGDIVDNTYVSATKKTSLNGVLNLQFATNAELVPAVEGDIQKYAADKSGLAEAIEAFAEIAQAGQGTNTNVSWNAFINAYNRAVAVNENPNPSVIEVRNAVNNLAKAAVTLEAVSRESIQAKVDAIREMMGTTDETVRYVVDSGENGYVTKDSYTSEEKDNWNQKGTISRVDYNKNMFDEGNGIYTNLYSDESWNALANALYEAEAVLMNPNATDNQINAALTALENAEKALTRQVFFTPYEYNGKIYYEAKCDADKADTYGKWYDSNFKRIVADVTILNLNAYARPATIMQMGQELYVASSTDYITPDVDFLEEVFPELRDVQVKGVHWNDVDSTLFTQMMMEQHYVKLQELVHIADTDLILELIATSNNPENDNYGAEQWLPSDQQPTSKTAAGTKWMQIRDSKGVPVYRAICGHEGHTHTKENGCYVCQISAHYHTSDKCYTKGDVLICGKEVHAHAAACYGCGDEAHEHTDACLTCTVEVHDHTDDCYNAVLTCTTAEHIHNDSCTYDKLICTKEVHEHEDACKQYLWQVVGEDYVAPAYFTNAKTNAKALVAKWENNQDVTAEQAEEAIADLYDAIVRLYDENMALLQDSEKYQTADMTANQRLLLQAAVDAAKTVEGYEEKAALKAASERAETILTSESGVPTQIVAADALVKLNEELTKVDAKAISEYNTLIHKIPDGFGSADIVYDVEYPGIKLKLTGKTGNATLNAQVLTTDGVVVNVSKQITVYDKADFVGISNNGTGVSSLDLFVDNTGVLTASLKYKKAMNRILETPKSYTWASSDPSVVSVTVNGDGTASYVAHKPGTAMINVTIATVEGNAHAYEIPVIVNGIQKPSDALIVADREGLWFWNVGMEDEDISLSAELVYNEDPVAGYVREEVKSVYFKSHDKTVCTVKNKMGGTATLTPVAPGATWLEAQITTVNGNTYTARQSVYVECDRVIAVTFAVDGVPNGQATPVTIEAGNSVEFSVCDLTYYSHVGYHDYPRKEQIVGYGGRSGDENVVTVTNHEDGTFTVQAVAPGEAYISLWVVPESGWGDYERMAAQKIRWSFMITVPDPNAESTEPATEPNA